MSPSNFRFPGIASNLILLLTLIGFVIQAAQPAQAQYVESVPYTFTGGSDGAASAANLIADTNGNFYGTTVNGGDISSSSCPGQDPPTGCGVVFELSPPKNGTGSWIETVLYTFSGGSDGAYPQAGLVMDSKGNLYGTTSNGGDMSGSVCSGLGGCGVVFELSPPSGSGSWTYSTLHTFTASAKGTVDGGLSYANLIFDSAKVNLYGTTLGGGASGYGTVFELSPSGSSWTETVLYSFAGNTYGDGDSPAGNLVFDPQGNLYGTTSQGGTPGKGVIFELTPPTGQGAPWTESVLFTFTGKSGAYPYAGLTIDSKNNLYGTTAIGGARTGRCNPTNGCGVVFELSPPSGAGSWTEKVIYTFESGSDGGYPYAGLILDSKGNLYGTTVQGGNTTGANCSYTVGCGVVFELSPPSGSGSWPETVLYAFNGGTDGGFPYAAPMFDLAGNLYGTTSYGGNTTASNCEGVAGCGVVFELALEGGPVVRLQPSSLIFGAQVVGTTSKSKTVIVTNTGTSTLDIDSILPSAYFAVTPSSTCGSTLAVGKTCKVFVTFTPTVAGALTGTLAFTDNATNSPQTVQLSGTGELDVTLTPARASYAKRKVGTTSPAKTFTLANNQTVTLTSINTSTTGDFKISASTCAATLASKQKCTISVTFTPTQTGTRTGELKVTDSAASSPQTATLSGTGD
ncbi:MAG: choice-of-anchor tandem repeat GloVer-containing protein [Terriglobales bacterium]